VKFIGEIGGTNAVYAHFIERPGNLQGMAYCAIGVNSLALILSSQCCGECALDGRGGGAWSFDKGYRIPSRQYCGIDYSGRPTPPNGAEQDRTSR
jgi:hypothetical protein